MEKFSLTKNQIKGLVALGVVAIIFILNNRSSENPDSVVESEMQNQEQVDIVKAEENSIPVINDNPKITDANKESFALALKNGSDSFMVGEYTKAISYFNQALIYNDSDVVYIRLFGAYNAQGDLEKAQIAIDTAIKINPKYTDYWNTKLSFMDDKTSAKFSDMKSIYSDGLKSVNVKNKVNLVTHFATIAEKNNEKSEAISLWEYAKILYPQNTSIYQAEIDRLNR